MEWQKNGRLKKEISKPKHSPFILDIPMISLPLPPKMLFGGSQELEYSAGFIQADTQIYSTYGWIHAS
jgi:hypothetical protein